MESKYYNTCPNCGGKGFIVDYQTDDQDECPCCCGMGEISNSFADLSYEEDEED